jgi:hypothetical protein
MVHVDTGFGDCRGDGFLESRFEFCLGQFPLVGSESQSCRLDLEDLPQGVLEFPSQPNCGAVTAGDFRKFDKRVSRGAERVGTLAIGEGPEQASFGRLFHQFGDRVYQIPSRVAVGQSHQGDLMLMDPLPELGYVLGDNVGLRGVADDIAGHEQRALGVNDRDGGGFLAYCIDHQDPVSTDGPLEHHRFEVFDSRLDERLVGIFFEDR